MTRVVWKYPLTKPEMLLQVPEPGIVRTVAWQHDNPTLWIEVDPDKVRRERLFYVMATGQEFALSTVYGDLIYVGSAVSDSLVFHVYEVPGGSVGE